MQTTRVLRRGPSPGDLPSSGGPEHTGLTSQGFPPSQTQVFLSYWVCGHSRYSNRKLRSTVPKAVSNKTTHSKKPIQAKQQGGGPCGFDA